MQGSCTHSALNVCVNCSGAGRAWATLCALCFVSADRVCVCKVRVRVRVRVKVRVAFLSSQRKDIQALYWSSAKASLVDGRLLLAHQAS